MSKIIVFVIMGYWEIIIIRKKYLNNFNKAAKLQNAKKGGLNTFWIQCI